MTEQVELLSNRDKLVTDINRLEQQLKAIQYQIKDEVEQAVVNYLSENDVSGENYKVTKLEYSGWDVILINLVYSDDEPIDESFEDDPEWEDFTGKLAESYGLRLVTVPYWYYPK